MIAKGIPLHGLLIAKKAGVLFHPGEDGVVSRVVDGVLQAGFIYQNYNKHSVCLHAGGFQPRGMSIALLRMAFFYPFVQLGCVKVFTQVPEHNDGVEPVCEWLGFKHVTLIPDVFARGGLHVLVMDRSECRWLSLPEPEEELYGWGNHFSGLRPHNGN